MRKTVILAFLLVIIIAPASYAEPFGVGVFGGVLYPIVQEDQASGYLAGVRVRINLSGPLALEPNLTIGGYGDAEIVGVGKRAGSSIKHYGVDLILGGGLAAIGPKPYLLLGGAVYNTKRDGDETTNKSGWSLGLGVALGLTSYIDVDVRGRANIVSSEGSASKKSVEVTAGVTYYFGAM